jgi:hypothetical protein
MTSALGNARLAIGSAALFGLAAARRGARPVRSPCGRGDTHYLRVFPPNQLAPLYLAVTAPTCSSSTQILTVSAVRAGAGDAS